MSPEGWFLHPYISYSLIVCIFMPLNLFSTPDPSWDEKLELYWSLDFVNYSGNFPVPDSMKNEYSCIPAWAESTVEDKVRLNFNFKRSPHNICCYTSRNYKLSQGLMWVITQKFGPARFSSFDFFRNKQTNKIYRLVFPFIEKFFIMSLYIMSNVSMHVCN